MRKSGMKQSHQVTEEHTIWRKEIFVKNKIYDFQAECTYHLYDKHNYEIIEYVSMEDVI